MRNLRHNLYYTLEDAEKWALFSGDYNPIHFDLDWVRTHGGEQLSVHGMRALLDAKQFASEQMQQIGLENAPYVKCVVRLRYPLWNDIAYDLISRNKVGSVAILSTKEQQNCLTCQLSTLNEFKLNNVDAFHTIPSDKVAALQGAFGVFSEEIFEWQFLDAVLFQHLIHDTSLLRQENIAAWIPEGTLLKDIFSRYSVVQTHQEVIFDSDLLIKWTPKTVFEPIQVHIQPSLVIGDMDSGLLICIKIIAKYKNKFISNSITLKVNSSIE